MQAFARVNTDNSGHKYITPSSSLYQRYALRISQVPEEVVQMASGYGYVLLLGESGRVWVAGRNDCGQLGLGDTDSRDGLTQVVLTEPIRQVATGTFHALLLTESGVVLAAGDNRFKQLGMNAYPQQSRHTAVGFNEPVKLIGAASSHSAAVTESGQLYITQCGLIPDMDKGWQSFRHVGLPAEVIQLKTTQTVIAVVTRGGQLWIAGGRGRALPIRDLINFTLVELNAAVTTLDTEFNGLTDRIVYVKEDRCRTVV